MKFIEPFKGIVEGDRYARDFHPGQECPPSLEAAALAAGAVEAEKSAKPKPKQAKAAGEKKD